MLVMTSYKSSSTISGTAIRLPEICVVSDIVEAVFGNDVLSRLLCSMLKLHHSGTKEETLACDTINNQIIDNMEGGKKDIHQR